MDVSVQALEYWHWLTLGILLLVAEVAAGGASFLMWVGFAALATGVVAFLLPVLGWQLQLVLFGVGSVASVLLWRRYVKDVPVADGAVLNRRGTEHIGQVVRLEEAIVNGRGRIRIDDTLWGVRGADAPAGTAVRIVALDGNVYDVVVLE